MDHLGRRAESFPLEWLHFVRAAATESLTDHALARAVGEGAYTAFVCL